MLLLLGDKVPQTPYQVSVFCKITILLISKLNMDCQSINQSIFYFSKNDTYIQITLAFKMVKIDHKLNKISAKMRKINK